MGAVSGNFESLHIHLDYTDLNNLQSHTRRRRPGSAALLYIYGDRTGMMLLVMNGHLGSFFEGVAVAAAWIHDPGQLRHPQDSVDPQLTPESATLPSPLQSHGSTWWNAGSQH